VVAWGAQGQYTVLLLVHSVSVMLLYVYSNSTSTYVLRILETNTHEKEASAWGFRRVVGAKRESTGAGRRRRVGAVGWPCQKEAAWLLACLWTGTGVAMKDRKRRSERVNESRKFLSRIIGYCPKNHH
jgi:hypothetical protein